MKCPNCNETLLMAERNFIEIDYCPSCRGVWLDKGELDKMLDAAEKNTPGLQQPAQYIPQQGYATNNQGYQHNRHKPYKKKSFLGDLFDFD